jgi:hypothetical protein
VFEYTLLMFYNSIQHNGNVSPESHGYGLYKFRITITEPDNSMILNPLYFVCSDPLNGNKTGNVGIT